jgi:hypothetical protein
MRAAGRVWLPIALVVFVALTSVTPASAHDDKPQGQVVLTIGWGEEPAYSGVPNYVDVRVTDKANRPVTKLEGALTVEVSFGSERLVLSLVPSAQPGAFAASLVPTRAGTYAFHITGALNGQPIDVTSSCSEQTFDCVTDVGEVQFPARDPSAGELAARLDRELPRAASARSSASTARALAIGAIAVAVLALAATVALGVRRGRENGSVANT